MTQTEGPIFRLQFFPITDIRKESAENYSSKRDGPPKYNRRKGPMRHYGPYQQAESWKNSGTWLP